jgi:thiamine phosphate synthase YjbQ (UPF0047 family)
MQGNSEGPMKYTELHNSLAVKESTDPPSPQQSDLSSLLDRLVDMDLDYEHERKRLNNNSFGNDIQLQALEDLRVQHAKRRAPFLRELALLRNGSLKHEAF